LHEPSHHILRPGALGGKWGPHCPEAVRQERTFHLATEVEEVLRAALARVTRYLVRQLMRIAETRLVLGGMVNLPG
jgi:hypothetical protein